jgi:predicted ester cyclase
MSKFLFSSMIIAIGLTAFSCKHHQHHSSQHQKTKNMQSEQLKATAQKFYDALSTTPNENTAAATAEWMAANWNSTPTPPGGAELAGFVQTLNMFHGMIPDLKWEVQEMLVEGNRVIVRSKATGTPNSPEGYFFGVPTDGSKSFEIQTIDIHTIEGGKMVRSFHTEDWATAIQQVGPSQK